MKSIHNICEAHTFGQSCTPRRPIGRSVKLFVCLLALIGMAAWGGNVMAATRTSTAAGGLWAAATTWVGGVVPANNDSVIIATTGAGAVTLGANPATMVAITVNAGSNLNLANFRIRPSGAISISGTLNVGTNTGNRFTGMVTVNAGGVWTNTTTAVNFRGGLTNNGTFTAGTGIQSFTTVAQTIGGASPISIPNLTASGIALTNNGNLTVSTALAGNGSLINSATGTLDIGGTSAITTLTANAVGNTVNFTGAAQTVKATAYYNLGLGGSGVKTLTGVSSVTGSLTMSGTATATLASAMTVGGNFTIGAGNTFSNGALALNVAGNFTQGGTFTAGTGIVTLNGAGAQIISGTLPPAMKLTDNNAGGLTLTQNETLTTAIVGAVTLTSTCPANYTLTHGATVLTSCAAPPTIVSINTASVNPSTPGAAVVWTVVFSKALTTGPTAANFGFVQTGTVSGAAITSVTGSGATWTVNANTGTGTGSLGLNLLNVTGIVPAMAAATFTGQVYNINPPLICATDSFTGANNAAPNSINWGVQKVNGTFTPLIFGNRLRITDISNNSSTRVTNKNIFPFGNNIVVAEFDYWAYGGTVPGADGIAITFSDPNMPTTGANNPPTAGGFGGSLGYANRDTAGACNVAGFTGGWIGVGIDEWGNYSNPTECRNGGPGFLANTVVIRGSGIGATSPSVNNYAYLTGTAALGANGVALGTTTTAYRYRITLDSKTDLAKVMVKVEQDKTGTGASYVTLLNYDLMPQIAAGKQTPLPSQLQFTFTGSTGGSTNYHEVDNVSICAASLVSALNHVKVIASSAGMALTPVAVTLTPHDAAHGVVSNAGSISLSTSTGLGTWTIGGGTGTLTPGAANSGLATYIFGAGETSATLGFTYQTAGAVTLNVANAAGADLLQNTPAAEKANTINFTVLGYVFTNSACVDGKAFGAVGQTCTVLNWPTQVAGQNSANVYITALNGSSVPTRLSANATNVSMQYGLSCIDPIANAGKVPTFTATANIFPVCQGGGAVPASWTPAANISFPASVPSAGPFIFNYPDVGMVELWMRNSATTTKTGSSGAFVVKPGGFVLSAIKRSSDGFLNPSAGNAAGAKFVKADEMFSVTVTATTCRTASATCTVAGAATPNFGHEVVPESVVLTPNNVIATMVPPPALSGGFGSFVNGVATGTAFIWDEVGIITLTPSVAGASYLTAGDITGTVSGNIGRFYPDHFETAIVALATAPLPCPTGLTCPAMYNGFVYSGQPFAMVVTAKSGTTGTTLNYNTTTGFAKPVALSVWGALGTTSPATGAGSLAVGSVTAFDLTGSVTELAEAYAFTTLPTLPSDIYIRAQDSDGVTSLRAINPATTSVEGGLKVVSGRVKIANAYGSELLPMTLPAMVQYYSSAGWVGSSTDNLTPFSTASIVPTIVKGPLAAGNLAATVVADACADTAFCGGFKRFTLTNSGNAGGSASICLNLPAYLQGIPACAAGTPGPNSGLATFGVYLGNPVFIYRGRHGR